MKLKKLIAAILALISTVCIAVSFSGCKDEISLPPMTETEPIVATIREMDYYKFVDREDLEVFKNYYYSEFKQICDKKFYCINLERVAPEERRWFYIKDTEISVWVEKGTLNQPLLINPIVFERYTVYDSNLGNSITQGSMAPWSIRFDSYMLPLEEKIDGEDIVLKFGKLNNEKYYSYYINMYLGEICIGVSYFNTNVSVSLEWFEDFFTRHLVFVG